jgi:hypothetical protein
MITNTPLTEDQIALCKDIRRRGKNKVSWSYTVCIDLLRFKGLSNG